MDLDNCKTVYDLMNEVQKHNDELDKIAPGIGRNREINRRKMDSSNGVFDQFENGNPPMMITVLDRVDELDTSLPEMDLIVRTFWVNDQGDILDRG